MVTNIFDAFERDRDAEEKGVWVPLKFNAEGEEIDVEVKLRRVNAPSSLAALEKARSKYADKLDNPDDTGNKLTEEEITDLNLTWMVEGVILDWRGASMCYPDGKPIPFTKKDAYKLIRTLPDFGASLIGLASKRKSFLERNEEADLKNS